MALPQHKIIGNLGEDIACRYLQKHGFRIIERNYWKKWGELDIIAEKEGRIHFLEVKSVSGEIKSSVSHETDSYRPEDNMHPWKIKRLTRAIQSYLIEKEVSHETWQLDLITVVIDTKKKISRVSILENSIL